MVRCFIGIMMPEELKEHMERIKEELSSLPMNCKFVEGENLHICLSFLGEVDNSKIKNIPENLDTVCKEFSSFSVVIDGMKTIPNENYIRVLALDVVDRTNTIEKLVKEIQRRIGGDSHPPHLTLCRIKSIRDKQFVIEKIKSIKTEEIPLFISSIQLIQSELKKTGPVYSSVYNAKLR